MGASQGANIEHISIHALLAESDLRVVDGSKSSIISIHALLAESDNRGPYHVKRHKNFYPRSPCGERPNSHGERQGQHDFYPRSPCGERRYVPVWALRVTSISIHALLAESDNVGLDQNAASIAFLSTLSLRRATKGDKFQQGRNSHFYPRSPCGERHSVRPETRQLYVISIHALLAESDHPVGVFITVIEDFYPRSPCGERLINNVIDGMNKIFLSTLSLRRATVGASQGADNWHISIHALLAESDQD